MKGLRDRHVALSLLLLAHACGGAPTPTTGTEGEVCVGTQEREIDDGCPPQSLEWDDCRYPALRRFTDDPVANWLKTTDTNSSFDASPLRDDLCNWLPDEVDSLDVVGRLTGDEFERLEGEDSFCSGETVAHMLVGGAADLDEPTYRWTWYQPLPTSAELAADLAIYAWADGLREEGLWDIPSTIEFSRRLAAVSSPPLCETPFPACPGVPLTPELERLLLPVCLDLPARWDHPPKIYDPPW